MALGDESAISLTQPNGVARQLIAAAAGSPSTDMLRT
jgi:hypothetical protein